MTKVLFILPPAAEPRHQAAPASVRGVSQQQVNPSSGLRFAAPVPPGPAPSPRTLASLDTVSTSQEPHVTPSQPVHLTRGQGLEPREMPHELKAGLEHRSEKGLKVYLGPRPRPGGREGSAQGPPQEHRPIPRTAPGAAEKPGPGLLTRWTHLPFSSIPRAHWPAKPRSHQESQPGNRLLQEEDEPEPLTPSEAGASESDTPGGAGTPRWARCSRPASAAPVSASPGQSPCPRPTRPCCGQVPGCGGCECKRAPPTPAALGTPTGASGGHGHRAQGEPTIQNQARASILSHLSKPAGRCHTHQACHRGGDADSGRRPGHGATLGHEAWTLPRAELPHSLAHSASRARQPPGPRPRHSLALPTEPLAGPAPSPWTLDPSPPTTSLGASRSPGRLPLPSWRPQHKGHLWSPN